MRHIALAASPPVSIDVTKHLGLVKKVAGRLIRKCPSHIKLEDLISAGNVGLLQAARRFDSSKCQSFEAFAEFRIKGAMADELRSLDILSRDMRTLAKKIAAEKLRLEKELGRIPEPAEIAIGLGVSLKAFTKMRLKTETKEYEGDDDLILGRLQCGEKSDPYEQLALKEAVALALACDMPDRQKKIVISYFLSENMLAEIASRLDLSESRVSQLLKNAIESLRAHCGAPSGQPAVRVRNAA
jgi:RNA polymerase sigma factor for flagellar operon FliA